MRGERWDSWKARGPDRATYRSRGKLREVGLTPAHWAPSSSSARLENLVSRPSLTQLTYSTTATRPARNHSARHNAAHDGAPVRRRNPCSVVWSDWSGKSQHLGARWRDWYVLTRRRTEPWPRAHAKTRRSGVSAQQLFLGVRPRCAHLTRTTNGQR